MTSFRKVDIIIVGQGLAGTTLAWKLLDQELDVVVLDRGDSLTSSRIAAGLMTPITGKRLVLPPDWPSEWAEAKQFYRDVENRTETCFFFPVPILRLFQNEAEQQLFNSKFDQLQPVLSNQNPEIPHTLRQPSWSGFEMTGGRLDVPVYLDASRKVFAEQNAYLQCDFCFDADLVLNNQTVIMPRLGLMADRVVFCQGFQHSPPEPFARIRFNPCKGEILTIQAPDLCENRVLHHGFWISPTGRSNSYRTGATYDWNDLSTTPTDEGRRWIESRLQSTLAVSYDVEQHVAAIRPTMHDFQPVIGFHPDFPQLGVLNGLGSKGSLTAPRLARLFVEHFMHGMPIPPPIQVSRWFH